MLSSHSKGNPGVSSPNNGLGLNSHESHESHKSGESTGRVRGQAGAGGIRAARKWKALNKVPLRMQLARWARLAIREGTEERGAPGPTKLVAVPGIGRPRAGERGRGHAV